MARTKEVSDSVVVAVDPLTAYRYVSDVTRTHEWSPENTGADVPRSGPLQVGDEFVGSNKRGAMRWQTRCVVTVADEGERFAFSVREWGQRRPMIPLPVASWEYRFDAADGGTRITETWTDDRRNWPDAPTLLFDRLATGRWGFAVFQQWNIRTSLDRLQEQLAAQSK